MSRITTLLGTLIQLGGLVIIGIGVVLMLGFYSLTSGVPDLLRFALNGVNLISGITFVVGGLLIMGFGEMIHLLNRIATSLTTQSSLRQ